MSIAVQIIVGIIAILGALFFLTTGIAMNRAADAVTRANMGSPAIYVGSVSYTHLTLPTT